jgi:hypothetical protein
MAESMESEKTTVTSMRPYPDIFSEDKYDIFSRRKERKWSLIFQDLTLTKDLYINPCFDN